MTLVERLRHRDRIVHPNSRETFDPVKEAADEIERLNGLVAMQKKDMKVAMDRIAELEGALRWEAGEECENPEGECVVDYPDGPDLWCRYCRIMSVLAGGHDDG